MSELLNEKQKQDIFDIINPSALPIFLGDLVEELLEDLTESEAEKLVNFIVDLESKEV